MEDAAAASETSIRPPKRGRDLDPSDGGPSTSTHLIGEKPDQVINGSDQVPDELDQGSGDGLFDDLDELEPRTKKKRTTDAIVVHKEIDQSLIDVIKSNGKLIPHAVKNWVERYENNPKSAIVELLMMLFEACGAKYHLDEGSLDETDVDDVVVSLVNHARNVSS